VRLVVEGTIADLVLVASISGPILTRAGGSIGALRIGDAIVQATGTGVQAIEQHFGKAVMRRVTVLGPMRLHWLDASEVLAADVAVVDDVQGGCFRFGAAPAGSQLPHPYRLVTLDGAASVFVSQAFGHPGYAQLSAAAPEALRRGAENRSEIGALSGLNGPIRLDGLAAKYSEFMPFGLVPLFIMET
jgi:hypothetical protein